MTIKSPTQSPFYAKADGVSNNSVAIQKWLDYISGREGGTVPDAVFCHKDGLIVRPNTKIIGCGKRKSVFKNIGGPSPGHGWRNEHLVLDPEAELVDEDIDITGIGWCGIKDEIIPVRAGSDFVTFAGVRNLNLEKCGFAHRQLDGIVLANNDGQDLIRCEFWDLGTKHWPAQPGDVSFVGGSAIFNWRPSWNSLIHQCFIHDCPGGLGIWTPWIDVGAVRPASDYIVTENRIARVCEAGIVGCPPNSIFERNDIWDVWCRAVSGHGAELAGEGFSYSFNRHRSIDCSGILAFNPRNAIIVGNGFADVARLKLGHKAIDVHSWPLVTGLGPAPENTRIALNYGTGDMALSDRGGGAMTKLGVTDNNLGLLNLWAQTPNSIIERNL